MKLTGRHLARLKRAVDLRGKPMPVHRMIIAGWRQYAVLLAMYGIVIGFFLWQGWKSYALLVGCFLAGILYRDLQWMIVQSRFWPVSDLITDWPRVDELIRENEHEQSN